VSDTSTMAIRGIQVPAAGRYRLDPVRTTITFRTKLFGGLQKVAGNMRVGSGEITVEEGPKASMTVTVNAASFWTGNPRRDEDIRSPRFFDAEKYREFTFHAGALSQEQGDWRLAGELTVKDITKPVTLTIEAVELAGDGFRARATTTINRFEYGFTRVQWMGGRSYDVELLAVAEPV
jgi:polyisoprenoid-binding protein YceI